MWRRSGGLEPRTTSTHWSGGAPSTPAALTNVREICLARLDKTRPVVVLTRAAALQAMTKVTVAPITSTIKGLSSEVHVGPENGLEESCAISLDNVVTIPRDLLGRTVGYLRPEQERALARAVVMSYDLDIALYES